MNRNTYGNAQTARIAEALNIAPTDGRFAKYVNAASERILWRGKYWGTYVRYAVTPTSQFFTVPPFIDTVEKIAVCRWPIPVRGQFFEYLGTGWGTRDRTLPNGSGVWEALVMGTFPTVVDVSSPGGTLTVKCDVSTDVAKTVLILGYDLNNNWVRTNQGGVVLDGEVVALSQGAGTNTVTQFSSVTGVQVISTVALDGQWWLYQGGVSGTLLSNYQFWETNPSYKRYQVPFINSTTSTIEIMGKKAFYPVKNPNDYLVIGNLHALKLGCMAILAEEDRNFVEAAILWTGGTDKKTGIKQLGVDQLMDDELQHQSGDGEEIGLEIRGNNIGEVDPIPALL